MLLFHRQQNTSTNEVREGTSYAPGCALEESLDVDKIPAPILEPPYTPLETMTNANEIIFDLETTGLGIDTNYFAPLTLTFEFFLLFCALFLNGER